MRIGDMSLFFYSRCVRLPNKPKAHSAAINSAAPVMAMGSESDVFNRNWKTTRQIRAAAPTTNSSRFIGLDSRGERRKGVRQAS